ncbi:MAG TPA: sigma-70 family RNA polymerase sigma factor [Ktedonobacterales bacterium]|nr:sigma-70 family RNA polymerase sigma factor [Ktedonobacterales bacterium]
MEYTWVLPVQQERGIEEDEAALIVAAQANLADFDLLYRRYVAPVYRYLRTQTSSADEAADLTQQVFLQALRALPRYRPRGAPFAAWLFQIAHHVATDAYRRRRQTVSWDALPEALQPLAEQDPEAAALQRETLARLATLLARLDASKREVLALHFAAGLSVPNIAKVVGKSPAAVSKQLSRTIQKLKESYREP